MGEVVSFNRTELQVISEGEAAGLLGVSTATLRRHRLADSPKVREARSAAHRLPTRCDPRMGL